MISSVDPSAALFPGPSSPQPSSLDRVNLLRLAILIRDLQDGGVPNDAIYDYVRGRGIDERLINRAIVEATSFCS